MLLEQSSSSGPALAPLGGPPAPDSGPHRPSRAEIIPPNLRVLPSARVGRTGGRPACTLLDDDRLLGRLQLVELPADAELTSAQLGADWAVAIIVSGGISTSHQSGDGRELLTLALPGDFLPPVPGDPAAATLGRSWRRTRIGTLSGQALQAMLADEPAAGAQLLAAALAQQAKVRQQYVELAFQDVSARVAKLLLLLDRFEDVRARQAGRVEHGFTQSDMAKIVAASRETVNKALSDFARRGWIVLDDRSLWVVDRAGLERRSR